MNRSSKKHVGTRGTHLLGSYDLNQGQPNADVANFNISPDSVLNFAFREAVGPQFELEGFNVFNHPHWGTPDLYFDDFGSPGSHMLRRPESSSSVWR